MVKIININTKTRTIHVSNAEGKIKAWRTTESGAHFPIKEGESTKEALDKFVEKKRPGATPKTAGQLKKAAEKLEYDPAYHYERADRLSEMIKQREKELDSPNISPTAKKAIERGIGDLQLAISKHWDAAGKLEKAQKKQQPTKKESGDLWAKPKSHEGSESFKSTMQETMKSFPRLYDFEKQPLESFAEDIYGKLQENPGKEKEVLKHYADAYKSYMATLGPWVDTPTLVKSAFIKNLLDKSED